MSLHHHFLKPNAFLMRNHKSKTDFSLDRSSKLSDVKNFDSHISKINKGQKSKKKNKASDSIFKSAFTLQQSDNQISSFSKANRFPKFKETDNISSLISLPSTLTIKNYNLGYGNKNYLPKYVEINARENPSPSTYLSYDKLTQNFLSKFKKGPSFGLSYAYYDKTYIPGYKIQNIARNKKMPGPGKYEVDRELGDLNITKKRRVNIKIKGRRGDFIDEEIKKDQSPKKYYFPKTDLVSEKRFNAVTFGKGMKFDFTHSPTMEFPGPGHYEVKMAGLKKKARNLKRK